MENKKNYFWLILVAIVAIVLIYLLINSIIIFVTSILIAFIFKPIVDFLEKNKIPRFLSVIIIYLLFFMLLFLSLYILIPNVINQFEALIENLSEEKIRLTLSQVENEILNKFPFLKNVEFSKQIAVITNNFLKSISENISKLFLNLFSFIAILFIIPFITFFLLKDSKNLVSGFLKLFPQKYYYIAEYVTSKTTIQLSRYVRGWILDATIVGLLIGIGLKILGINNSISIGFIAGLGHLIPYFGPIIGGIPALIISLIQFGNFSMLLPLIIMFTIVYTFDNGFIQPKIFSKSTDIHPVVIIFLILAGSELLGLFGMLIAVPTATIIKTVIKEINYAKNNLIKEI